jgi:hypothetical protein
MKNGTKKNISKKNGTKKNDNNKNDNKKNCSKKNGSKRRTQKMRGGANDYQKKLLPPPPPLIETPIIERRTFPNKFNLNQQGVGSSPIKPLNSLPINSYNSGVKSYSHINLRSLLKRQSVKSPSNTNLRTLQRRRSSNSSVRSNSNTNSTKLLQTESRKNLIKELKNLDKITNINLSVLLLLNENKILTAEEYRDYYFKPNGKIIKIQSMNKKTREYINYLGLERIMEIARIYHELKAMSNKLKAKSRSSNENSFGVYGDYF